MREGEDTNHAHKATKKMKRPPSAPLLEWFFVLLLLSICPHTAEVGLLSEEIGDISSVFRLHFTFGKNPALDLRTL